MESQLARNVHSVLAEAIVPKKNIKQIKTPSMRTPKAEGPKPAEKSRPEPEIVTMRPPLP